MSHRAQNADQVYLSVIFWPEGMARNEVAALIADAANLDRHTVHLRLGKSPPTILGLFPRSTAYIALVALHKCGGSGFAASIDDLKAFGPTLKIRDLRIEHGLIQLDLWRGQPVEFHPSAVQIVVRARLSERTPKAPPTALDASHNMRWATPHQLSARQFGFGGAFGMALGIGSMLYADTDDIFDEAIPPKDVRHSHKLDLHMIDGKVYQIDGDKFGFQILGDLRGHSDNQNIDAMCDLFATLNNDVIVDPYFSLWTPPAAHHRLRLPMMHANNEEPAFAFYSRWAALMYRHILNYKH